MIEIPGGSKSPAPTQPTIPAAMCPELSTVHLVITQQNVGRGIPGLAGKDMMMASEAHKPSLLPCQQGACAKWCMTKKRCGAVCGCGSCGDHWDADAAAAAAQQKR